MQFPKLMLHRTRFHKKTGRTVMRGARDHTPGPCRRRVITAKSATAGRPAPCALFLSSSPTTRATARTKATASAERRPGAPA
jgi:hypothetical protein